MIIKSKTFLTNSVNPAVRSRIIAEIYVDDAAELPAADGIDSYELAHGSLAYVVHSGELYVMDGSGNWCNSEDGSAPQTQEIATQSEPATESELPTEAETTPEIVNQSETVTEPETQTEENPVDVPAENAEEGEVNDKLA